jgi:hypothetical protein
VPVGLQDFWVVRLTRLRSVDMKAVSYPSRLCAEKASRWPAPDRFAKYGAVVTELYSRAVRRGLGGRQIHDRRTDAGERNTTGAGDLQGDQCASGDRCLRCAGAAVPRVPLRVSRIRDGVKGTKVPGMVGVPSR